MFTVPPKVKVTKEMILDAAFNITRREGIENVSARTVSRELDCSTQPIMYNFPTAESLRKAVRQKVDDFHMQYIMDVKKRFELPVLEIAVSYVRFAAEEPKLFRCLFQSGRFSVQTVRDLIDDDAMKPMLESLAGSLRSDVQYAKEYFFARYLMVHGFASLVANNSIEYNEDYVLELIRGI